MVWCYCLQKDVFIKNSRHHRHSFEQKKYFFDHIINKQIEPKDVLFYRTKT